MKAKTLHLFSAIVLSLIVCMSFASAASTFTVSPSSVTFNLGDSSHTITITNANDSVLLNITTSTLTINGVSFSVTGDTTEINTSSTLTIEPIGDIDFSEFDIGEDASAILTITNADNSSETENITVSISTSDFCNYVNEGNDLKVKIDDIDNLGVGSDDNWYPFDTIKADIIVENKGNDDIDDISLEWGLYSKETDSWIIDVEEEDVFDLTDDDEDTFTLEFELDSDLNIDVEDLRDGKYVLYVRATGTQDSTGSPTTCAEDSEQVDINIEKHYVTLKDFNIVGSSFCGSTVQLTSEIWNLGSKEEEDVKIKIYNSVLGIDEEVIISSIDEFDDKKLNLEFTIPEGIEEKTYHIDLEVYDSDGDIYEGETESSFQVPLEVSGNCVIIPNVKVLASLESGGKAGKEMKIKATITNEESTSQTYSIKLGDYSDWAELISIEPEQVTLDSKESKDITLTLKVNSDADEIETFNILAESSKGGIASQPVEVSIEKGFSLSGIFNGNGYLWGIAILNIVLILIIIIIAIKVARN